MILADTSVWVQHLRSGEPKLARFLLDGLIVTHPFVTGELACGDLKNRASFFSDLDTLPGLAVVPHQDVLKLLEQGALWGRGLGWVDLHLLAAALLSSAQLWTLDRALAQAAERFGAGARLG